MIQLGHATDRKPPFRYAAYTRVAFSDTDAQGVVYYGRYLPYFDLARTEYHRQFGPRQLTGHFGPQELTGSEFVMRASAVEYRLPARFDDLLEVFIRIARIARTSVTYEYAAYSLVESADELLLVTATQTSVLVDRTDRTTVPIPESFRSQISAFEGVSL